MEIRNEINLIKNTSKETLFKHLDIVLLDSFFVQKDQHFWECFLRSWKLLTYSMKHTSEISIEFL